MSDPANTHGSDLPTPKRTPGDPEPEPAVVLNGVSLSSGSESVWSDLNLTLPPVKTTLVMGPSGSGKSALLKVCAGLIPPDAGTVHLLGRNPATIGKAEERELRRLCGFVFQDGALWQNLTVFQNLALPLDYHERTAGPAETEDRVRRLAEAFGMQRRLHLRPAALSAGERKMVSFLRALCLDPQLLFLDEPTSVVDHRGAELILKELRELKERGVTIVASSHSARFVSQMADHLVVLDAGMIAATGPFVEVVHGADRRLSEILSEVLGEAASFDTDLLDLLSVDADADT
ncbi:MAG: ABC transporter ATP-binding protein [Spirochaetaceae bacterium]